MTNIFVTSTTTITTTRSFGISLLFSLDLFVFFCVFGRNDGSHVTSTATATDYNKLQQEQGRSPFVVVVVVVILEAAGVIHWSKTSSQTTTTTTAPTPAPAQAAPTAVIKRVVFCVFFCCHQSSSSLSSS